MFFIEINSFPLVVIMKRADIKSMNFDRFIEKIKQMDDSIFGNRDLVENMVAYSTRDQAYVCFPSKQEVHHYNTLPV
jgi:hypothetical protein